MLGGLNGHGKNGSTWTRRQNEWPDLRCRAYKHRPDTIGLGELKMVESVA
jgi:hypothetical protein